MDRRTEAFADYQKNTEAHSLKVLCDDGEYRHLSFSHNGSNIYRFDLITWPGYLTICGDMGTYTFTRLKDMFTFFRDEKGAEVPEINPGYWAEKLVSVDKNSPVSEFDTSLFRHALKSDLEGAGLEPGTTEFETLWQQVESDILFYADSEGPDQLVARAMEFDAGDGLGYVFNEIYEYNLKEDTFHFLWALYAIVDGIRRYDAFKEQERLELDELENQNRKQWSINTQVHQLDRLFNIVELEDAGLVVESREPYIQLMSQEGDLYPALLTMLREGRKNGEALTPMDRSFIDESSIQEALASVFKLTSEQACEAVKQLNWKGADLFEQGKQAGGCNKHLVLVEEDQLTVVDDEYGVVLSECPTTLRWSYVVLPKCLIRKNNGKGRLTAPYGYYTNGVIYQFEVMSGADYEDRESAFNAAMAEIAGVRAAFSEEHF